MCRWGASATCWLRLSIGHRWPLLAQMSAQSCFFRLWMSSVPERRWWFCFAVTRLSGRHLDAVLITSALRHKLSLTSATNVQISRRKLRNAQTFCAPCTVVVRVIGSPFCRPLRYFVVWGYQALTRKVNVSGGASALFLWRANDFVVRAGLCPSLEKTHRKGCAVGMYWNFSERIAEICLLWTISFQCVFLVYVLDPE